ncbi:MAG: dTDP-4-dehydrorhamnose 3,5-epimerase [Alphaproteobacteria bacterium]|nr:dTDP-4-dehydrorhamnose 3,5-epimerase [Alphaproteobacteria bacterium]
MKFTPLPLSGAWLIDLEKREDARGFFARQYCEDEFAAQGLHTDWVQLNTAMNVQTGTVRGLHFQLPPKAEIKLVRCLKGAIFDVIVDLRQGSDTFGKFAALELSDQNRSMLYIPEGFAHGYQTLAPQTELLYFHSERYSPGYEGGLRFSDPTMGIKWPLKAQEVSPRDLAFPTLEGITPLKV